MSNKHSALLLILMFLLGVPTHALAESGQSHFDQALRYQLSNDTKAAIVEYHRGLQLEPTNAEARAKLGVLFLEEYGDIDGALSELITAINIDPSCTVCQRMLDDVVDRMNSSAADNIARGNDYYRNGQLRRAAAAYRVAIYVSPKNADAQNSTAWTLYRLEELTEALAQVKIALQLQPDNAEYINTLACILFDQGNLNEALTQWHKAISKSKTPNPADLYGLAVGYLAKGNTQQAREYFAQAIKSDDKYKDPVYLRDRIGLSIHTLSSHDQLLKLCPEQKAQ